MRKGDKGKKVLGLILIVLLILMFVGSIFSGVVAATTYDPQAAVNYADTWWNGRNPNYHAYSSEGGNCATLQWNSVSNSNADKYLYDMGIATGQSVGYYEPNQTQLDSTHHNIEAPNQLPTAIIDSITTDPAEQGTDTVSFTGHGTDPDGTVVAYNWSSSIDGLLSTSAAFTKQASELSVGTHTIYFKVQDDDGTWSTEDTADLTIYPGPELSYSPESHDFCDMRECETDSTTFEIWNSGTDTLTYSLSETCDWLEVHPTNGSSTGEHDTITVGMDTTGLFEGTHTGDITINSNDGTGTFTVMVNVVPCPCGNMSVNLTSWSPTLNCSESDNEIVTVSATGGTVKGVTVSKVSGPTWLSVSPTDLGDIASGSNKTFTMTAAPPSETSGDFGYTVRVSNTCGTPSTRDVSGTIHVDCPESSWRYKVCKWTYMVYLDGDNNLEGAAIDDFLEMSLVGSTSDVNIVVQFDRIPGHDTSYGNWEDCKRFHVTYGMTPTAANAIENLGECNMGNPNTLTEFVEWAMTEHPAENYALVLWNHGSGWKLSVPWMETKGICWDDTSNDHLTLQETGQALSGKYVELLGNDACLMQMIEVAYQMRTSAGIIVGSEETEPWDGWPYDTILSDLTGTPTMSPSTLGGTIVSRYIEYYPAETLSAMNNGDLPGLATAVDNFAQVLIGKLPGDYNEIKEARNSVQGFYDPDYIDLYHFAELIKSSVPGTESAAQAVMDNVDTVVYADAHGSAYPNAHGLTVYYPKNEWSYWTSYENTDFAIITNWDEFLMKYYEGPSDAVLSLSPQSHNFGDMCEYETDSTTFDVWNSGTGTLTYSLSETCGWVDVHPTSGSSTGEHDTITIDIDTTGLFEGSHTCDISISSNGGSETFTVMVNVVSCECDGTATSCGIYPNCVNCNEDDGCYVYDDGCEERDYYCVSNDVGCGYTYSNRHTDYYDDWAYYCDGDTVRRHRLFHDYYCDGGTCTDHTSMVDDQLVENCNDHDGWVDTGNTRWVDDPGNSCKEKEQKEQKYHDYSCSDGACTYIVTDTHWVDTENTRNKDDGSLCGCTASNTLKSCDDGICTDTGICNATICGADATCDGRTPGESCGTGSICNATCSCVCLAPPEITSFAPESPVNDSQGATRTFNITITQTVNVSWQINGTVVQADESVTEASYTNLSAVVGTWNVSAIVNNANGTDMQTWIWTVTSPCFIATAAYGTPLHEDIDVLRDFRDHYLMTNPAGRVFVKIYYSTSPPVADVIREHDGLRTAVRDGLIKPLVYLTQIVSTIF